MRGRRLLSLAAVAVALCMQGGASPAAAGGRSAPPDVHVEVNDFAFDPGAVSIGSGQTVVFDFVGPSHHTVTDASGMAFYGSGSAGPGDPSFPVTYPAAGGYLFTCIPHPWMGGRVTIPMRIHRIAGAAKPSFRIGWASSEAATGFVYDVQITRPGGHWVAWQTGVTARSLSFTPAAGPGDYRFRARMRSLTGGEALWSPAAQVHMG